ncbi:MAG: hypothetical protein AAF378_04380 [Cyanobacteria bacterium P01_A01_bin.84]
MNKKHILSVVTSFLLMIQACASNETINTEESNNNSKNTQTKNSPSSQQVPNSIENFDKSKADKLTDTAKLLAGMQVSDGQRPTFGDRSSFFKVTKINGWKTHQNFFQNSWSKLENQQISKVREWTSKELQQVNSTSREVFYPFSGPDFLYAYSLFPKAKKYILVGLEPVGSLPDFSKLNSSQSSYKLQEARNSLYGILKFSFFRTNDMKVDLKKQGVLPILSVFMARTGNRLLDLQYIGLDKNANVKQFQKGMIPGIKIAFTSKGESNPKTLYYFSTDLSNDGMKKNPQLAEFVKKQKNPVTYLKAASYLMYYDNFSKIKNVILSQSDHILQDDSGMPLKSFNLAQWDLKFYGNYTRPIGLFSNRYQSDLRKVYANNSSIEPLNFGIGYQFGVNKSNLMLATPKKVASKSF